MSGSDDNNEPKYFDLLDQLAIRCICQHLNVFDTISLKRCSHRLNRLISKYISDVAYNPKYLEEQYNVLTTEVIALQQRIDLLKHTQYKIAKYQSIYTDNIRPDGYMSHNMRDWIYCSVEYATTTFFRVCVKANQPEKQYIRIQQKMESLGFQRVFIPGGRKQHPNIKMMFTKKGCEMYNPFYICRVCGKDHTLEECPKVMCNICNTRGHLTRRCPSVKCKICNTLGQHLTSRCPYIKCNKCKKKGHVSKRCTAKQNVKRK